MLRKLKKKVEEPGEKGAKKRAQKSANKEHEQIAGNFVDIFSTGFCDLIAVAMVRNERVRWGCRQKRRSKDGMGQSESAIG